MLDKTLTEKINQDFECYISLFNDRKHEIISEMNTLKPNVQTYFKKAITQIIATDIISINLHDLSKHVKHIYDITNTIEYCRVIPLEIIFNYILPYRINDENFELYAPILYKILSNQIDSKSITATAININYWCFSNAVYHQADDRTQNAITTIKSGFGRCGEESVLLASALRSVGIPARQCYSPYWLHCDDNHAWVEVFTGGKWQFLGACEPEEKLNIGWFNNAASKAGIIRHRIFNPNSTNINSDGNYIYTTKTSTSMYAPTKKITTTVLHAGNPIANAKIGLYTINYCKPSLLFETETKQDGTAEFEIGYGDMIVSSYIEDIGYDIKTIETNQTKITLNLANKPIRFDFNLIPYEGTISTDEYIHSDMHNEKIMELQAIRINKHNTEEINNSSYYKYAQLNYTTIEKFLKLENVNMVEKQQILNTLTEKDFTDITLDALRDMLLSFKFKDKYPNDIFYKYVLPLRVENEHIYAQRYFIEEFCKKNNIDTPKDIYEFLSEECSFMDNYNYSEVIADIKATLKYRITTEHGFNINTVQVMRALGIPSRLNSVNGTPEYYDNGNFRKIYNYDEKYYKIKLNIPLNTKLKCGNDYTICKMEDGYFKNQNYNTSNNSVQNNLDNLQHIYKATNGIYAITQSTRQIDGSNTGNIQFFAIENSDVELSLDLPINKTHEKLRNIEIPASINQYSGKSVVAFIQNNSEPTEHFLNELIEYTNTIQKENIKVFLYIDEEKNSFCQALKKVQENNFVTVITSKFTKDFSDFRKNMHIGDLRLPFITAAYNGKGLYSFANYNVGTVELLLNIFRTVY